MIEFLDNLRKGRFSAHRCIKCRKVSWPPSKYCQSCGARTRIEQMKVVIGKVLEFGDSYAGSTRSVYGIVDISGARLMGLIENTRKKVEVGMTVRLTGCGISDDGRAFYLFEPNKEKT